MLEVEHTMHVVVCTTPPSSPSCPPPQHRAATLVQCCGRGGGNPVKWLRQQQQCCCTSILVAAASLSAHNIVSAHNKSGGKINMRTGQKGGRGFFCFPVQEINFVVPHLGDASRRSGGERPLPVRRQEELGRDVDG